MPNHFPVQGLLPKVETQAASFLKKNPTFDGRGTVIAILDTGVDPNAPGMQVTSHGLPKVIDVVDCTGSGDVSLSDPMEPTVLEGVSTLKGLSGRTLKLGAWSNPTGKYRVGMKHFVDLFPKSLVERLKEQRLKDFKIKHHELQTAIPSADDDETKNKQQALKDLIKNYSDPGILIDCVVWHDGKKWRAAIDTNENGDLTNAKPLTNFADERESICFNNDSLLTVSVNFYDDGETLSLVSLGGAHGTHVAAIAAANFPDNPELNGVAPGAQIVSLKIGDTRVGSMETGSGLVRAALYLAKHNIDLANMSYGEASSHPNMGRFIEILKDDVINKNQCIFVSSAGNNGPALSTVGAPGGMTDTVFGVGAYINKSAVAANYASLLENVNEKPYTWSSRGPTMDGDVGVDIYAPGVAITSVPLYLIQNAQLMNGTSMSGPNACGCMALLVSGLKATGSHYNPYLVMNVVKNASMDIQDPMKVGFIQVEKAWDLFKKHPSNLGIHYQVTVGGDRGIYLRDERDFKDEQQFTATIQPIFVNKDDPATNLKKVSFSVQVNLVCSESWIQAPSYAYINNEAKSFAVRVHTKNLSGFNFGYVYGYDCEHPEHGPLFRIPVTACRPLENKLTHTFDNLSFNPGDIKRFFVQVPSNVNMAEIIINAQDRACPARFIAHLVQLAPESRYNRHEQYFGFTLNDAKENKKSFSVLPDTCLEVCLAQFWSSLDLSTVNVEIRFSSILVGASNAITGNYTGSANDVFLNTSNSGLTRIDFSVPVKREEVSPSVSLDVLRKHIRPSTNSIKPLKSRDTLVSGQNLLDLRLTYSFKLSEGATVTPRLPRCNQLLYESCFDNVALYLVDEHKKVLAFHDIYPKNVKLEQGSYTVHVQVVAKSYEIVDKLQTMPLVLDIGIKSISLPIQKAFGDTFTEESTFKGKEFPAGSKGVFWVSEASSLPKDAAPGDLLIGSLEVSKRVKGLYSAYYLVPSEPKKESKPEEQKDKKTEYSEAIRDLKISWIKKMDDDTTKMAIISDLEKEHGKSLAFLKAKLEALKKDDPTTEQQKKIQAAANDIIQFVNEDQVSSYFGNHHNMDIEGEAGKTLKKEMDEKKAALVAAYETLTKVAQKQYSQDLDKFDAVYLKYAKWVDTTTDGNFLLVWAWRESLKGNHGTVVLKLAKYMNDPKSNKDQLDKLYEHYISCLKTLKWDLWVDYETKWKVVKIRPSLPPF